MTWIFPVAVSAASLAWFILVIMRASIMDMGAGLAVMLLGLCLAALNAGVWLAYLVLLLV